MEAVDEIRRYWDTDAATYDLSPSHHPTTALELAAWSAALARLLPPPPARVLDIGAGTGFLSLLAARLGHRVTALDTAEKMLTRLRGKADAEGLEVQTIHGQAEHAPADSCDVVIERHVVWTLPDPSSTLDAWRSAAPRGRLLLFESAWGSAAGTREAMLQRARELVGKLRKQPPAHHAPYPPDLRDALPLGSGTPPRELVELTQSSSWGAARIERLRDVEWAMAQTQPRLERLLGVSPRFVVIAG
jgi:SAM-dependent methyltransferase